MALPFTIKRYLKAKQELRNFKYFIMQKYNLQKNPLKETKILQDTHYNSVTKSPVSTQSQNIIFQKSSYKNRPTTTKGAQSP
jgi:hypothetical protein